MKKVTGKRLTALALAFVLVVSSFGFSGEKASAASTSTSSSLGYWSHWANGVPLYHGLTTSENNYSVYASVTQGNGTNGYWCNGCGFTVTLQLQRYTGYLTWTNVGAAKTGNVSNGHMDQFPFHARWDNIGIYNKHMRVKVTQGSNVYYGNSWRR